MKKISYLFLLTFVFALCGQALAGWDITYRVSDIDRSISYDIMLVENNIVVYGGVDESFIFDTKSNEFTFVFKQNQTYWSGNINEFRSEMNNAMKVVMDEIIHNLPEGQREMYAQMLGNLTQMYDSPTSDKISSINIKIVDTGNWEEISGYNSKKYEVEVDGKIMESIWLSNDLDISDHLDSGKIAEMLNQIMPNVEGELYYEFTDDYLDLWKKGFRMRSTDNEGEIIEVIKVIERDIADDELKVPEGFTKITPLEFMQQQMMVGSDAEDDDDQW